jgi:hypothetical protein
MALTPVNTVEKGLVVFLAILTDTVGLIPVLGNIADFIGLVCLNLYFFIKLGSKYLGGKRGSQKIANMLINGIVGIIPVVGNFVPELTIQAIVMFGILDKEVKEEAEAAKTAANDNAPRQKISRAA